MLRDRLFHRGVIDPSALDNQESQQHITPYPGYRSRLGSLLPIPPLNFGYQLLAQLGWAEGQGVGVNLQGRTEPCLPALQPGGLGAFRYKGLLHGEAAAEQLRV